MRRLGTTLFLLLLSFEIASSAEPVLVVTDPGGAAGRLAAPAWAKIDLAALPTAFLPDRLGVVEVSQAGGPMARPAPAQFVPEKEGSTAGTLWWLMSPGSAGPRRFRVVPMKARSASGLTAKVDEDRQAVDVMDGGKPVLRYNHGTVPPPEKIVERYEKNQKPPLFYARGDYIHPVFGPDGEALTDDYSLDHPHHRGICWAWPVVRWKGESRDLWAVRVLKEEPGGVWARPVSLDRVEAGPVLAVVEAENVWKWADETPIVAEHVTIRAFREHERCRLIDIDVRLTALVDDVSIGGRPHASYGGFTFRTYPQFDQRKIDMHIAPPGPVLRQAWYHLTGNFPGGKGPAGVLLMEHVANPDYPSYPNPQTSDAVSGGYPQWRTVQPAWPGDREVALAKGEPLVLKHRLWIHPGLSDSRTLAEVWSVYAHPLSATFQHK